jgi:type II secretory pathway pseudopilin PulG
VTRLCNPRALTLVEVVVLVILAGILATVAVGSLSTLSETARVEETKRELDALAYAIAGNPGLHSNGVRSDFGYVGDIGTLPQNLDALRTNPGGYATWKGPYVASPFTQDADDFKKDAWGREYQYDGGVTVTSTGGSGLVRRIANSAHDLLVNEVSGVIFDQTGRPPGDRYRDSVWVLLTAPNGVGGLLTRAALPDAAGHFSFDSIPVGNHGLRIVFVPSDDTLKRYVSVLPGSSAYQECRLLSVFGGSGGGGGLSFVADSDTLETANCSRLVFSVANPGNSPVTVTSMTLTWSAPAAYYKTVLWDGLSVRSGSPALSSGSPATFDSPQTVSPGESEQVRIDGFHSRADGGGPPVDMSYVTFTVEFSDGSVFDFEADLCNP